MELSGASISSAGVTLGFKVGKVVIETTPITAQFAALTACAKLTDKLSKNLGVKVPPIQCPVMPGFKLRA